MTDQAPDAASAANGMLEAEQLRLAYHRKHQPSETILRDFSLSLGEREVVALLGPSGVGKSTLLRALAGLQTPDAGQVHAFGAPLHKPHPRMGVVFQDACLLPWKTVRGNVGVGLRFANQPSLSRSKRHRLEDDALAEVGLEGTAGELPSALSGGMAQRVALARCLVREPSILLLDEPFSALDAVTRSSMQSLLLEVVRHHHASAVLVTHDIDEALRVADRVLLLHGRPATLAGSWTLPTAAQANKERELPAGVRDDIVAHLAEPTGATGVEEFSRESA